jgi:hypothetical protein
MERTNPPISTESSVSHSAWYPAANGEFAHTSAMAAATRRTIPPELSVCRNRWTGLGRLRLGSAADAGTTIRFVLSSPRRGVLSVNLNSSEFDADQTSRRSARDHTEDRFGVGRIV